ncbi:competence protein CoiA [Streptomyces sp. SCL15-4]|uniref:competence protein CoiA n=1 Tax=Streptomyces sp. SCL15-4 TaxID=2967221 RepID=UPI0029663662|nr:competence protein CoiA [Streptomyces sp. SCL15-4]
MLATDLAGTWKTALEAQLAPITDTDITARTDKMAADGVTSIWFSDRPRPPWLGTVPSVRVSRPDGQKHLAVTEGLVKFEEGGWRPVRTSLPQFLSWAFAHRIVPHTPRSPLWYPQRPLDTVWTAPQYIAAEAAHLEEEERRRRLHEARLAALQREKEKKKEQIRARNAVTQAKALAEATIAEQAARTRPPSTHWQVARVFRRGVDQALAKLADEHGVTATVGFSTGAPRYAGGVPLVDGSGVPAAVFDPDPHRVRGEAFLLLAGLLLIFPSEADQRRFLNASNIKKKHWPVDGYRTDFVEAPVGGLGRAWGTRICACATPQLVAKIQNAEYPAEPSEQMGPATALFRAECRTCGGRYDKPWRRTSSTPVAQQRFRRAEEPRNRNQLGRAQGGSHRGCDDGTRK